jgi:hypothetical protein
MAAFGTTRWKERPDGIRQLQVQMERGMIACALHVADQARANVHPYRLTGAVEDSIHTNIEHVDEWPRPAVFVATASGDGYFIEMGTVHSPARLFLSQALDSVAREFPNIIRQNGRG